MNGYDKFFKTAQDVRKGEAPAPKFKVNQTKSQVKPMSLKKSSAEHEQALRKAFNVKPRKAKFPWSACLALTLCLCAVGVYILAPAKVESLFQMIEILPMGEASASSEKPAEKSKDAGVQKEKSAEKSEAPKTGPEAKKGDGVLEDLSHFEKLKVRKEELDQREKELTELEEELQRQKVELEKRIVQLEQMRTEIGTTLKDRVEVDQEKVNKLVDLYSNMKPKQAADVIGSLNDDLAVEVLAKMKKKSAAEIMNLIPAAKARALSEKYTGYRRGLAGN